jgi:hypothetical protein
MNLTNLTILKHLLILIQVKLILLLMNYAKLYLNVKINTASHNLFLCFINSSFITRFGKINIPEFHR